MKKILLAIIIIFIGTFSVAYSQCVSPTAVTVPLTTKYSCIGDNFTLTASVSFSAVPPTGVYQYTWYKGIYSVANIVAGPSAIYSDFTKTSVVSTDAGTYTLRVEDYTAPGGTPSCFTEASVVVVVNPKPTLTGNLNICVGSTTPLIGSGTASATTGWLSATPSVATVNNAGIVTGISAGTSVITYMNMNGCTQTATVIVNPIPTITGPLNFCHGSTSQLTGSGIPNATTPWVSGAPAIVTINNNGLMIPPSCGSATITYTTSAGCSQTATVTVHCLPTISGRLQICSGSTTQLTGTGTPAVTDAWTSASPTVAKVDNTGLVTGLAAGTSIITYTNITGCIFTATVNVLNTSLAPSVSITANPGSTICNGTAVTFKANGVYGGTPIFEWSSSVNGTTILSTTDTYTSSNLIEGEVISVKMISSLSCASPVIASNSITVHVVSPGSAPVVSIVADKTIICSNGYTTFTATPSNGGIAPIYEWSINGASQGIPTSSPSFTTTALTSSFDVVSVRLTSNSVCASPTTATASMSINVTTGIGGGIIGTDQTICYNAIPAPITEIVASSGTVGMLTYRWEVSSMASGPYSDVAGATNVTFTPTVPITQDVYIRRVTTDPSTPAPCNVATSNVVRITVRPQLVGGIISSDETVCTSTVPTIITQTSAPTGGTGTFTYQWQSDASGAFANIPGATSSSYASPALIATTRFQRVETSGTCGSVTSNIVTKTVAQATLPTIHIDDPGQTCDGDIVLLKCHATNMGPAPIYNWYVNNNVVATISPTSPTFNTVNFEPLKAGDEVWVELQSNSTCASTSSVISNKVTVDLIPCTVSNSIYTTSNIDVLMQPYVSNSILNVIDYTYFWSITDNTISTGTTLSQAQSGINVFPNPTTGSFNIEMPESGVAVSYDILDLTGRSVGSGTFTSTGSDQRINADFGAGMYQVVLKYNNVVTCVRLSKVQ